MGIFQRLPSVAVDCLHLRLTPSAGQASMKPRLCFDNKNPELMALFAASAQVRKRQNQYHIRLISSSAQFFIHFSEENPALWRGKSTNFGFFVAITGGSFSRAILFLSFDSSRNRFGSVSAADGSDVRRFRLLSVTCDFPFGFFLRFRFASF